MLTAFQGEYDPRPLDVWSCAIVLLTMIYGGGPWTKATEDQPFYAKFMSAWQKFLANNPDGVVTDKDYPSNAGPIFTHLPKPAIKILILKMMHPIPEKRISIQDAVGDRWVKTIECCSPESFDEDTKAIIDASAGKSCKLASKMCVRKLHNHLPPAKSKVPQYRFDMGDGWS